MNKEEIFKDIEGFEGLYQISNYGRVYSVKSGKFLKAQKHTNDYRQVNLHKDAKQKTYTIHRLVAQAFIPNPSNLPQINHKDENPSNNHVSNLEWCSASYNNNYGSRTERAIPKMVQNPNYQATREKSGKPKKPVLQFTRQGEFVAEYSSTREAERQTGINQASISQCCRGVKHYNSASNYLWRYKNVSRSMLNLK
jgi:hypothetical protein